ncbi:LOG family protein [Metallosphaera javensis (ex Sakai et al. 2022)]|uniref:SLOG cluster 4 domain-containing protein n=1 Tax=Metallosphaera javensis (ex Sakai et al. 2022) TaxID=2775498 RepID=UPI00258DBEF9|nr:MAG: molybdenum cofactor carrier protein Mcp1 [Metallosphaera javensis (ex Sakai et al. 2022)]
MQIAIAALGTEPRDELKEKARKFVRALSRCSKQVFILGGYWGLMAVIVDEAIREGHRVVAIIPEGAEHVIMPSEVIRIDTGCDPRCRSVFIARSGDILVSLGGETGTMTEIMMAYAMGKSVYVLTGTGQSTDRLAQAFPERLDERGFGEVHYYDDPELMGAEICKKYYGREI